MSNLKTVLAISAVAMSMVMPAFANEEKVDLSQFFDINKVQALEISELSQQEMKETEGAVAPVVWAAVVMAGRSGPYIVKGAQITQAQAINILRNGGSVITSAQYYAGQLSNAAWGARNVIQHNAHSAYKAFMPHYQNISKKISGHAFWR